MQTFRDSDDSLMFLPINICARDFPPYTRRWSNVALMLVHRLLRWPNINPTLCECLDAYWSTYRANIKHLYNVGPTSSTLVQHCTNVIQMFCVYWVLTGLFHCVFQWARMSWYWVCLGDQLQPVLQPLVSTTVITTHLPPGDPIAN